MFFIGQNLKHVHMTDSFLELLIFWRFRSSRPDKQSSRCVLQKKVFLKISQNSQGEFLCQSLFFNKVADLSPFLQNTSSGFFWSLFLITPKKFCMWIQTYRIFSNLVWPLISADGQFFEIWTIFSPLISNAGKVLGIFDFPLI